MDAPPRDGLPPFEDRTDVENADRGFVAALEPRVVTYGDGRVVRDEGAYGFLDGDCQLRLPPQARVRGDGPMTVVEGHEGVIVVDPLISAECAAAALALYRRHRGARDCQTSGPVSHSVVTERAVIREGCDGGAG
ncbi:metallo-beta-lactamase superfamily protein [Streptomyces sp. Ag109_O5-1]|uniref:MBL fold metallo-hydrolase n=1 Tax=Streptomyces sp. Ag109_O5-1 TaxID=1938851 RepID=UPI000F9CA6BB|nr:MBL fold metallo-hydrolase [Streptomyces sp. Ag109_O5-1]RPE39120.1 metallo-beta-lactamase superfamily protein [Streptomyces sp. Ag109_O5-1]